MVSKQNVAILLSRSLEQGLERICNFAVVVDILESEKPLKSIDNHQTGAFFIHPLHYPFQCLARCCASVKIYRVGRFETEAQKGLGNLGQACIQGQVNNSALLSIAA